MTTDTQTSEILQIKTQIKHLAETDQHLTDTVGQLRREYQEGFKELRSLIVNQNKPHWQLLLTAVVVVGGFLAYQQNQAMEPIKNKLGDVAQNVRNLEIKTENHMHGGHPETVISKMENLEARIHTELDAMAVKQDVHNDSIRKWLTRIDEKGSIVHFGPKGEKR